ncbi:MULTISPECIES: lysophospholipid acyltransferase family protein [unclassified Bosea (in: a-proteobacteria)]|uniref:lysophospholipid acyltransferase family protein n=1 Tax=unclassified Bosea (in: a-proteobacteria) TaxID=2653178 RepID=UPI000F75C8C9|nr:MULTISPECIES: lysophospholipid acyltransferase family protein [unclassified Bosea (in: a-proteobacteria)]AZO81775.1 1-acyl-sn-glycerol-3-phosphate acyltransferase [Bosea sp. Tri-49]RXT26476.1 1-acyl-sn-glycerol-3-phosphate acyltransferase [Bosea sp. Tri-39]RXT33077.1 1-acyl-sn-glycerol-3-phosphate acyltransferase [Bosea sp. Tri-54]
MLLIRSLLFNVAFYLNLAFWLLAAMVTMVLPPRFLLRIAQLWGQSSIWLMRVIVGTRCEIVGAENIPPGGIIMAAKHQSTWETFALVTVFLNPVYILKRELTWLPFFGWCLIKLRMIPVDRGARSRALQEVTRRAKIELGQNGRQLMIFPEGTRRPAGAEPAYKYGVTHLYTELGVPCVPVALNAGLFWPRRSLIKRPGTIRVEILPAIPPGLAKMEFHTLLQEQIETASNRLLADGLAELDRLGVPAPVSIRQEPQPQA